MSDKHWKGCSQRRGWVEEEEEETDYVERHSHSKLNFELNQNKIKSDYVERHSHPLLLGWWRECCFEERQRLFYLVREEANKHDYSEGKFFKHSSIFFNHFIKCTTIFKAISRDKNDDLHNIFIDMERKNM